MILLTRFVVSRGFKKNSLDVKKVIVFGNHAINSLHPFSNLTIVEKKPAIIGYRKRRLCTQVTEDLDEDSFEDVKIHPKKKVDTNEIFEEISAGDPEILKKLKLLALELALLREEERRVPDSMNKSQWLELLQLQTLSKRIKYLSFLRLNELKDLNTYLKAEAELLCHQKAKAELGFHYYGLSGHTMFMRIYENSIFKLLYPRLWKSKLDIVIDCSYQNYMSSLNVKLCAKQVSYILHMIKLHRYPSNLKFCNFQEDDALGKIISNYSKNFYSSSVSEVYSESYLDLFPKERLLYLTPHAKNPMTTFNHDDVFIIGGFVDKGSSVKASLAKAKEDGVRMARLPIDEYLFWKKGTKSLPLNTVYSILLDMAFYNDWRKAFKNIPKRCLSEYTSE